MAKTITINHDILSRRMGGITGNFRLELERELITDDTSELNGNWLDATFDNITIYPAMADMLVTASASGTGTMLWGATVGELWGGIPTGIIWDAIVVPWSNVIIRSATVNTEAVMSMPYNLGGNHYHGASALTTAVTISTERSDKIIGIVNDDDEDAYQAIMAITTAGDRFIGGASTASTIASFTSDGDATKRGVSLIPSVASLISNGYYNRNGYSTMATTMAVPVAHPFKYRTAEATGTMVAGLSVWEAVVLRMPVGMVGESFGAVIKSNSNGDILVGGSSGSYTIKPVSSLTLTEKTAWTSSDQYLNGYSLGYATNILELTSKVNIADLPNPPGYATPDAIIRRNLSIPDNGTVINLTSVNIPAICSAISSDGNYYYFGETGNINTGISKYSFQSSSVVQHIDSFGITPQAVFALVTAQDVLVSLSSLTSAGDKLSIHTASTGALVATFTVTPTFATRIYQQVSSPAYNMLAISGDGNVICYADPNVNYVTVLNKVGGIWTQQYQFTRPAGYTTYANFGNAVALNYDGSRLAVGQPGSGTDQGWVHYYNTTTTLTLLRTFSAPDLGTPSVYYGRYAHGMAVALTDGCLYAGAPGASSDGTNRGGAVVYHGLPPGF